jgi:hypothetical protein
MTGGNINPLSITYSELPIVASRIVTHSSGEQEQVDRTGVLETLSVFYDEIWLPYPYGFDRNGPVLWAISGDAAQYSQQQNAPTMMYEEYEKWLVQYELLFKQGILRILPPPIQSIDEIPSGYGEAVRNKLRREDLNLFTLLSGELALAIHALYSPKPSPELFPFAPDPSQSRDTSTSRLAGFLAVELFRYRIPTLGTLTAEQILEARDQVKPTKEGFVDYIYEKTDEFEKTLKNGNESEWEVAQKMVERNLATRYDEFCRQLRAKRSGFWGKILEQGIRFLEIDASPWTPKFYAQVLGTFFGSFRETTEAMKEARKNSSQAYQFMYTLREAAEATR